MSSIFSNRWLNNNFEGEHLWVGQFGYFFIILSFVFAGLAAFAFFKAEYDKSEGKYWQKLARNAFLIHSFSIFAVFILLFIMIFNHFFEYHYAWRHSSTTLPMKYIISSFWEGQEGSFLLWQFWLAVMGIVGIYKLKNWENPVMGITAFTQLLLGSMVLGIYVFGYKIGSNPFILLRQEMVNAPVFQQAGYLKMIADGNGLNPLLQNYWMTIHPPVLFLGFASTLFPFAFAVSALIRNEYQNWVKPALPWAIFSVALLGIGILMGGAWAYESLSFGGFWAWDPVENMSFVPWLLIVAGLHLHLIYLYTKHSLFTTFLFYILGFVMVLYSTFLTRSGILGDTSVHAFTDLGMSGQLLVYLFALLIPALLLLIARYRYMPSVEKEEEFFSREFWMFVGALILFLSALQMLFTTSIPVWNKILHDGLGKLKYKIAPPENVVAHYNIIQIHFAILATVLMGLVYYLSYKSKKAGNNIKWVYYSLGISFVLATAIAYFTDIGYIIPVTAFGKTFNIISIYFIFLFTSLFATIAMLVYAYLFTQKKWINMGGAITHFGFAVFMVGVVISQYKKETISINNQNIDFGSNFNDAEKRENILLLRDSIYSMGGYEISYTGSETKDGSDVFFINYKKKKNNQVTESFTLTPNAKVTPQMGMMANPSTKHFLTKDIFTYVVSIPDKSQQHDSTTIHKVAVGDTFYTLSHFVVFKNVNTNPKIPDNVDVTDKLIIAAELDIKDLQGKSVTANPIIIIDLKNNNNVNTIPDANPANGFSVDITDINPQEQTFAFAFNETQKGTDFVIMKALVFPYINLVWIGSIISFFGMFLSLYKRVKTNNSNNVAATI